MTDTPRPRRRYGWRPSLHDPRDFQATTPEVDKYPDAHSLRDQMPPVVDQLQLGACTGNAVVAVVSHFFSAVYRSLIGSRLWVYYWERMFEGTLEQGDVGAYGRDGFKVAKRLGVPPETDWPYNIKTFQGPPPSHATNAASAWKIPAYHAVKRTIAALIGALLSDHPIAFGFSVPASFENIGSDGIWNPSLGEEIIGGHEVVLIGFRHINGVLYAEIRNSWGEGFGDRGHVWAPFHFIVSDHCSDFRIIQR